MSQALVFSLNSNSYISLEVPSFAGKNLNNGRLQDIIGQYYATNKAPITFDHDCPKYRSILEYPMHILKSFHKPVCSTVF